jgi:cysteine desulfurase
MADHGAVPVDPSIYFDNNATTQPLEDVIVRMAEAMRACWGNPSSIHRPGQAARALVESSRRVVAGLIGAGPADLTWTSGATEALDLAVRGVLGATGASRRVVLTTPIEHESVRECLASLASVGRIDVVQLPIDENGVVRADDAQALLERHRDDAALLAVQWANNETGVLQPIGPLGSAARALGIPFLVDGTQRVGKLPVRVEPGGATPDEGAVSLGATIDLLAFSAHKMHGPKGIGALYVRRGVRIVPTIRGVQERERRGGTENVPGIAGFAAAAEAASAWLAQHTGPEGIAALVRARNRFEDELLRALQPIVPGARINAGSAERLWNTTNLALPGIEAEPLVLALSEHGVAVSAGAACSSGSLEPSHVLAAMGLDEPAVAGSIRLSASRLTTDAQRQRCIAALAETARSLMIAGRVRAPHR